MGFWTERARLLSAKDQIFSAIRKILNPKATIQNLTSKLRRRPWNRPQSRRTWSPFVSTRWHYPVFTTPQNVIWITFTSYQPHR